MHQKATVIGMYDTLGPDAIRFIVNQTKLSTISIAKEYIQKLCNVKLEDQDGKMETLKNLVVFEEDLSQEERTLAEKAGLAIFTMQEVIMKGREAKKNGEVNIEEPETDDCLMFSYTSGTTGDPKGVKLTHRMVMTTAYACNNRFSIGNRGFDPTDTYVSYLPLAHSFE
jgi:long-chain acyl-CoA synthetase